MARKKISQLTALAGAIAAGDLFELETSGGSSRKVTGAQVLAMLTAGTLTVEESDGSPSVAGVIKIKFPNGSVTDNGGGVVTVNAGGGGSYAWGTWQTPTLVNGWSNLGGYQSARYVLEDSKLVRIEGAITGGTTAAGTTLFTLPTGYRPAADQIFTCYTGQPAAAERAISIYITTAGVVKIDGGFAAQTWISLSGIAFRID